MFTPDEIRHAVIGTLALLRGDPDGMRHFDCSVEGFFRSFGVFLLLLAPFVLGLWAQFAMMELRADGVDVGWFLAIKLGALACAWLAYPLIVAGLAPALGMSATYGGFVVTRNWASLVVAVPLSLIDVAYLLGLVERVTASGLGLFAFGFNIYIGIQITRLAARTPMGTTIGLVILETALNLLISLLSDKLLGI